MRLNNLTPGHQYQVQLWVDDSRQLNQTRTETVTSGGNTVTLSYPGNPVGGLGQYYHRHVHCEFRRIKS